MTDTGRPLRESTAPADPLDLFTAWFDDARRTGARQPEAAALATATPDGAPSVRMVLVKAVDDDGLVFYTNYESRKGSELAANPRGALMFFWDPPGRQVRVDGGVQRTSREQSADYAHTRGRGSQLSALASPQSRPIESREWLERRVGKLAAQHADTDVPLAESWGGFRLHPETFEFWQARENRLHDRLLYTRDRDGTWQLARLAP